MNDQPHPQELLATERNRDHVEPHRRSLAEQTLDALLRIEELLQPRAVTDRGNYEDRVTPEPKKPEPVKPAGKGKRSDKYL